MSCRNAPILQSPEGQDFFWTALRLPRYDDQNINKPQPTRPPREIAAALCVSVLGHSWQHGIFGHQTSQITGVGQTNDTFSGVFWWLVGRGSHSGQAVLCGRWCLHASVGATLSLNNETTATSNHHLLDPFQLSSPLTMAEVSLPRALTTAPCTGGDGRHTHHRPSGRL